MNIIEAAKSGKRFRRLGDVSYRLGDCNDTYILTVEDLMATDWEVEEPHTKSVTITYEDLRKVWPTSPFPEGQHGLLMHVAQNLGLI